MSVYSGVPFNNVSVSVHVARHAFCDEYRCSTTTSPHIRIYVVKEAQGTLQRKGQNIPFNGGNIYILPAETDCTLETTYFEKVYFHISVSTQEDLNIFAQLNDIYSLPCKPEEYDTLYQVLMSENYHDKLKLKMHILSILVRLLDTAALPPVNIRPHSELIKNALIYIQSNARSSLRVSEIAEHFATSESMIRNAFRAEVGMPIGKYIDNLVFSKAQDLLANSTLKISQISAILGFCDQFYFSQIFRKRLGLTPSQFRKKG